LFSEYSQRYFNKTEFIIDFLQNNAKNLGMVMYFIRPDWAS